MPPRSSRHRGGPRWLIIPFVLTIVVLLVDASMHARSPQPEITMNSQAWVDKALPEIAASSTQGLEIADLSSQRLTVGAGAVAQQLSGIAAAAGSTYGAVRDAAAPSEVAGAAGLLEACLLARENGAQEMALAVHRLLGGARQQAVVALMSEAVSDFDVSDSAYQLFARDMPRLGVRMPESRWAATTDLYEPRALGAFSARLLADVIKMPPQRLYIDAVSTNPAALNTQGKVEVLSPATSVSVTVVVGDGGRTETSGVRVSATITPAKGARAQLVSETVDLSQGQADAVTLRGLRTMPSTPTTLTVSAVGPGGVPAKVSRQLQIEVPGANFTGVPTTKAPARSGTGQ